MLPYLWIYLKYKDISYQNELKVTGVYLKVHLRFVKTWAVQIKVGAYAIKIDSLTYFDSFAVEYITKEIYNKISRQIFIEYRNMIHSLKHGYFCIGFIDFMIQEKSFLDHTNLFSLNEYEKNNI